MAKKKPAAPPASIDLAPPEHRSGWVHAMRLWGTLKGRASPQDVDLPPAGFRPDKGVGKTVWALGVDPDVGWERLHGRLLAAVEANNTNTGPMVASIRFVRDVAGYEMLLRKAGGTLLPQLDAAIEQAALDREAGVADVVKPSGVARSPSSDAFQLMMSQFGGDGIPMLGVRDGR